MKTIKPLRIHILPEVALKRELLEIDPTNTAAILCTDENISYKELIPNMLVVFFSDTTDKNQPNAITTDQAREIIEFLRTLPTCIQDLYVSCSAGQSRSPALAAAILRMSGRSDKPVWDNPHYVPNWFVYQTICRESGLFAPDWYVRFLRHKNRLSFRKSKKKESNGYECWSILE